MELKVIINDPIGLHARPAAIIVQQATKFKSDLEIESNGRTANLKSIMSVMAMAVKQNEEVTITATGDDAEEAIKTIEQALKDNNLI